MLVSNILEFEIDSKHSAYENVNVSHDHLRSEDNIKALVMFESTK